MQTIQYNAPKQHVGLLPDAPRLMVAHPSLTLAKRPSESRHIVDLHAAIKALAREAARTDHSQEPKELNR